MGGSRAQNSATVAGARSGTTTASAGVSSASAVPAAAHAGRGAARRWQPPSLWASYHEQPFDSQRNAEAAPATPSAWAAAAMVSPPRVAPLLDRSWYTARPFRRRTLG